MTKLIRGHSALLAGTILVVGVALGACSANRQTASAELFPATPKTLETQITQDDALLAKAALQAMLAGDARSPQNWRNAGTGHEGMLLPVRTFVADNGIHCVEYRDQYVIDGKAGAAVNTACLGADGAWANIDTDGKWQRIAAS